MSQVEFRRAEEKDAALILRFIRELAAYEKLDGQVVATELSSIRALRSVNFSNSRCQLILSEDGQITRQGYAAAASTMPMLWSVFPRPGSSPMSRRFQRRPASIPSRW